ncbi:hypothetical protein ACFL7M_07185 [Thermodesulfobacteriota bacterium]
MTERSGPDPIENPNPAPGSSNRSPAPVGVKVKTTIERGDAYMAPKLYNVEITLEEIVRGDEAREHIKAQGVSDKPPKAGFEYILTRIQFGYFRKARGLADETYRLTEGQFAAVSTDGRTEYEIPSVSQQPQPKLIDWLFHPGESREGWILFQVPKDNMKPLLVFKREHVEGVYGIWRYVWFQL